MDTRSCEARQQKPDEPSKGEDQACADMATSGVSAGSATVLSDSSPSSRDTSPSRGMLRAVGRDGAPLRLSDSKAVQFVTQLAQDLRQLISVSHRKAPFPTNSPCPSQESSPRS